MGRRGRSLASSPPCSTRYHAATTTARGQRGHAPAAGAVLYNTLGHCRGHYDMAPLTDWYPAVERGAWTVPAYHELLRRGLRWAIGTEG